MPTRSPSIRFALSAALLAFVVVACGHQTPVGATPVTPVPSPTSPADLGRLFVEALAETRYVSAVNYLAPALKASTTDATLRSEWGGLATLYGKYRSTGAISTTPAADGTEVDVPVTFVGGSATLHLTVNPSLQIASLDIPKSGVAAPPTPTPSPSVAAASSS